MPELHLFAHVESTNDALRARAGAGAPAGTVAIAELQHAGRGQHGRRWVAPPGTSILMSVLLRPSRCDALAAAPLRVGLAAAQVVQEVTALDVMIKWPNDLMVDGRKLGGILCEAVTTGGRASIVAGIGINCLQREADFPPGLAPLATSLRIAAGRAVPRALLAGDVVRALLALAERIATPLAAPELKAFAARDALHGRALTIDGAPAGHADGITASGALRVRDERGTRTVHSGSVRAAGARDVAHERAQ